MLIFPQSDIASFLIGMEEEILKKEVAHFGAAEEGGLTNLYGMYRFKSVDSLSIIITNFLSQPKLQSSVFRAYRIYLVLYFQGLASIYPYHKQLLLRSTYSYWIIQKMDELFVAVKTAVPPFFSSESWYLITVWYN